MVQPRQPAWHACCTGDFAGQDMVAMVIRPSSILAMKCASTLSGAACGPKWACNGYRHFPCMHLPIMSRSMMVYLQASVDICAPLVAVHIHVSR